MKKVGLLIAASAFALTFPAAFAGCSSDDSSFSPPPDASLDTSTPIDARTDSRVEDAGDGGSCAAAKESLLAPVDGGAASGTVTVSPGSDAVGPFSVFEIDASKAKETRVYVHLSTGKVDITDQAAQSSTAWDLAVRRNYIFSNSGDGGPGQGGALRLADKSFETVTAQEAQGKDIPREQFFDADCKPLPDPTGFGPPKTTFSEWYDYSGPPSHVVSPKPGAWLVRGATGKLYRLQIETFYSYGDGGTATPPANSGHLRIKVGAL